MDFQKIENFLTLARCLNYTKAANSLFISQSVLSRQIAAMEEEIGIKLFYRNQRNVELTPAGRIMVDGLQTVYDLYGSTLDRAKSISTGFEGCLNICSVPGQSIASTLAPLLKQFKKEYPDIDVTVMCKSITEIKYFLQNMKLDFVFARIEDFNFLDDICFCPIATMKINFVCSINHPLSCMDSSKLTEEMTDDYTFLWSEEQESEVINNFIERRKQRAAKGKTIIVRDFNTLLVRLEMGMGFTFLNDGSWLRDNKSLRYKYINWIKDTTEYLIWRKTNTNPSIDILAEYAPKYNKYIHLS